MPNRGGASGGLLFTGRKRVFFFLPLFVMGVLCVCEHQFTTGIGALEAAPINGIWSRIIINDHPPWFSTGIKYMY